MRRALRIIFRRGQIADAVDDEIAFHLDMRTQRLIAAGMSPDAARREALRQFGDLDGVRRDCVTFDEERERTMRRRNLSDELRQDAAYAARTLRRNITFSLGVVLTLTLGIGANIAIFTLVEALLLRPLDVPHPEQLVAIGNPARTSSLSQGGPRFDLISYPLYREIAARAPTFSGVLASGRADRVALSIDGHALEHARGRYVSANYFSVLGVPAAIGRTFSDDDDRAVGASPVVVISHAYWMRRFAGDRGAVGKKILLNEVPVTIIGVAREGFRGAIVGVSNDVWLPLSMQPLLMPHEPYLQDWSTSWLLLLGRRRPTATYAEAHAVTTTVLRQTVADHAREFIYSTPAAVLEQARSDTLFIDSGAQGFSRMRYLFHEPLLTLMAGVALLLLIVCANVANLLLARGIARGREIGVRLALGAGRARLVRQLLTESLMLGVAGAAGGLLLGQWGSRLLVVLATNSSDIGLDLRVDLRVLGFTMLVGIVAVALFGLVPALRAARVDLASTIRASARALSGGIGSSTGRKLNLARLLIVGQVALSVVLLGGAALLVRSLRALDGRPTGLDREHLLIVDLDVGSRGYVDARRNALVEELASRFRQIPSVRAASYSENGIFSGSENESTLSVPGFTARSPTDSLAKYDEVGPGYVAAIGAHLLQGRELEAQDGGNVAVVNERFAQFYFPGRSPVGEYFKVDSTSIRIVGVVNDIVDHTMRGPVERRFYTPYLHPQGQPNTARFEIRTAGDPAAIAPEVRRIVTAVDPRLPVDIDPLDDLMRLSVRQERLLARLATAFGVAAVLLAALGLYGVITYSVTRRTGEIGLRVALGAQRSGVVRLVVQDAMTVVLIGFVIGLPVALGAFRLLGSQLHGVGAGDPMSIGAALAVLTASAFAAVLAPAWKASRVDPIVALREE